MKITVNQLKRIIKEAVREAKSKTWTYYWSPDEEEDENGELVFLNKKFSSLKELIEFGLDELEKANRQGMATMSPGDWFIKPDSIKPWPSKKALKAAKPDEYSQQEWDDEVDYFASNSDYY